MKATAKQMTDQYIYDTKQYIHGCIADHLINDLSSDNSYFWFLTDAEIQEFSESKTREIELRDEVETFILTEYSCDISEFIYNR